MTSIVSSAKGQRLTRSEEKLVRQEEEKKRSEEEEIRLAAERVEQERIEKLRLEEEERTRIAEADKERKQNELPELIQILERNRIAVTKMNKNLREMNKWQRYMRCDGTPDPAISQAINTFINLTKENPNVDVKSLFEGGGTILQLLDELEILLSDTPPDELPEATANQYQQTIWDLQELLSNINDKVTDILLQKAIDLVDIETGNMQEVVTDENITLCLWANFNKNPSAASTSSKDETEIKSSASSKDVIGEDVDKKLPGIDTIQEIPTVEIDDNIVDFRLYTPLGGVYYYDVLKLPPQPKFVKGWRIVQLKDTGLQTCIYPPESTKEDIPTPDEKEGENPPAPPAGITIKLPPKALFFEQPKPARWDPEGQQWRTDGIHSITFEPEEQILSFKMDTFNIFTLTQRYHINMPFQFWEIRPLAENDAILTVVAAFITVKIRIKDLCQLCPVSVVDNISNLRGKWMSASSLIVSMINAGLNIFPGADSEKYVQINAKNKQLTLHLYTEMALVSSAIALRCSKWNFTSDHEEILLQACESLSSEMIADEDWSLYMVRPERSHKLKMKESSEELSNEIAENTDFYSNLYHMMRGLASDAAKERILTIDNLFNSNMHEILDATQLLTHTVQVN
ncbi:hypothetical protein scyTo_0006651 [Scyliorhinus torazame]|uniref:Dynein axonemal intermediate chain 7 n=1 Tax=Scyliorhinus torazame TaxID=75743 RepID=A0A401PJ49_SCYTO|nr:hypothetical protein [Scyliorhinus torazame]